MLIINYNLYFVRKNREMYVPIREFKGVGWEWGAVWVGTHFSFLLNLPLVCNQRDEFACCDDEK